MSRPRWSNPWATRCERTQIASQAVADKLTLVTHNVRHFDGTPGLHWEDWMVPAA